MFKTQRIFIKIQDSVYYGTGSHNQQICCHLAEFSINNTFKLMVEITIIQ